MIAAALQLLICDLPRSLRIRRTGSSGSGYGEEGSCTAGAGRTGVPGYRYGAFYVLDGVRQASPGAGALPTPEGLVVPYWKNACAART